jgi:nucleotide-binding universal stress UspA family protein
MSLPDHAPMWHPRYVQGYAPSVRELENPVSVLVFYKSTPEGAEAIRAGATQAAFHGSDLVVHNVPADEAAAETVVALASGAAAGSGVTFHTVAETADAVDDFLAAAAAPGVELLVLGIRHRTAVGKLILGSTEQQILLDAPCPVLAVKA